VTTPPFACVVADLPLKFGDTLPGAGRGAARHYDVMPTTAICRFALPAIADDAVLLCWRVAAMQQDALDVVKAWGFTLKSEIVWRKVTKNGKRWFGMGRYVRAEHETCLIAVRGRPQINCSSIRSVFDAPAGRHSEKPNEFYAIVERLCAGPRVELFSRRHRTGWTCLGNELEVAA
jgi:N6-adenosine-specific RNA methylase IME4